MISLKLLRLLRGKNQFELSLETQIPSYRLSLLENGKAEPKTEELKRLAKALETTTDRLMVKVDEGVLVGG